MNKGKQKKQTTRKQGIADEYEVVQVTEIPWRLEISI